MAKGASKSAAERLECRESVGEYPRTELALSIGRSTGYWRSRRSCTVGPVMILIAGSMICTTSSPTQASCWWPGIGCGTTRGHARPGVDGETAYYIEVVRGLDGFLAELRDDLKARTFQPLPARRRAIPKAGGKVRYLGIATIRDRVAQASLEAGVGAHFRDGFSPVFLRVPSQSPGS